MKITLEPTDSLDIDPRYSHSTVTVEIPYDPDSIGEIIKNLIIPVLLGSGFQRETIDKYIEPFEE
jgi:hypothetical protein